MEPFNTLRVKFAEACAKYGQRPFCLAVEEVNGFREPPMECYLGYCGLPLKFEDGEIDSDIACRWFAVPLSEGEGEDDQHWDYWSFHKCTHEEVQQSKEALKVFIELATQAAAALPAEFRDLITPNILEDMKIHYDPHPPSSTIVWWLVFLWWQFDREFYAHSVAYREQKSYGMEFCRYVVWHDPFMASVSAIDRGGLLYDVPPDEIVLREVDEEAAEERRQEEGDDDDDRGIRTAEPLDWFTSEPRDKSEYEHGPIEGTMQELAAWTDTSRATLKRYNGERQFYIQAINYRKFRLWCKSEDDYGDCCTRRSGGTVLPNSHETTRETK